MAGPNFWENDPVVGAAPAQGGPRPVYTAPNPQQDRDNSRDAASDAREAERLRIALAEEERKRAEWLATHNPDGTEKGAATDPDRVAQVQSALANIKRLREMSDDTLAVGTLAGRVGSIPLVGAFLGQNRANIEGALQMVQGDLIQQQIAKLSQANGGKGVASIANSEAEAARMAAAIANLDPNQSLDEFTRGLDRAEQYYMRQLASLTDDGTRTPEMRGGVPVGTEVEFGAGLNSTEGFDRNAALAARGLDANKEAAIAAFWNGNRGNAGLTADGVKAFYTSIGSPLPTDEEIAVGIDAAKKGYQFGDIDLSADEAAWKARVEAEAKRRAEIQGSEPGIADVLRQGLGAGLTDEVAGVGTAVGRALTGDFNIADNYRLGNDVEDYRLRQAREATGGVGTGVELLGNAASLGMGAINGVPASVRAAIAEGAMAGAVPGFGYGEGAGESVAGAAIGAGSGALIGRIFAPRGGGGGTPTEGARVIQAADDLNAAYGTNIRPLPADVGGAAVKRTTAGVAQSNFGAEPIIEAGKAVTRESEAAKNAIAATVATPQELETAGAAALGGARKWMQTTGAKVNSLYTKARKLSEGVAVPLTNARRVLDEHIAELEATPGGADGVASLKALRDELGQDYSVDAIKRMRTTLRDRFMGDGIRKTDIERRVGQVIDAAEQDVADGLNAAGRSDAAKAWSQAAAEARNRLQTIDNVLAPVIGKKSDAPKSGEQIMQALGRLGKGDNAKLAQFINALPAEEAGTVRATVISRLGTKNAEGTDFTLGQFLGQWEKMPDAAKRTMFGGELTAALDKLATVAGGSKEAMKFANHSNTGSNAWTLANMGGAMAGLVPGIALVAGQKIGGRLLASPRFARWLAKMPTNPTAAQAHIKDLSKIAAAESAIAADALNLQSNLVQLFPQGSARASVPLPLAAQEPTRSSEEARQAGGPR